MRQSSSKLIPYPAAVAPVAQPPRASGDQADPTSSAPCPAVREWSTYAGLLQWLREFAGTAPLLERLRDEAWLTWSEPRWVIWIDLPDDRSRPERWPYAQKPKPQSVRPVWNLDPGTARLERLEFELKTEREQRRRLEQQFHELSDAFQALQHRLTDVPKDSEVRDDEYLAWCDANIATLREFTGKFVAIALPHGIVAAAEHRDDLERTLTTRPDLDASRVFIVHTAAFGV